MTSPDMPVQSEDPNEKWLVILIRETCLDKWSYNKKGIRYEFI